VRAAFFCSHCPCFSQLIFGQWDLHTEAPDLFLHLSHADLVVFKGDLNHRKLTYDCAAPASTPFDVAIGPMASSAGAPRVCSLRTIKVGVPFWFILPALVSRECARIMY
jgi:Damage-control phosphatase ARMT1-like domain